MRSAILVLALALSATACQSTMEHASHGPGGNAAVLAEPVRARILAEADWTRTETVDFELRDYGVKPREVRFKAGQPYRLIITNNGSVSHYFNATEFLHQIATRKAQVPDQAEVKADFFNSFEIARRGGNMELYFVPVTRGTYVMHCHLKGKEHEGVEGTLIIE